MKSHPTPPKIPRPLPAPRVSSPLLGALLDRLGPADTASLNHELEALTAQGTPLVETPPAEATAADEQIVTFLYKHPSAQRVLIFINRLTDERNLADSLMEPVGQSSYFAISFRMKKDWRASYCFIVQELDHAAPWEAAFNQWQLRQALDEGVTDPHNPLRCLNSRGRELSVVQLEQAPLQPYLSDSQPHESAWLRTSGGRQYFLCRLGQLEPESPIVCLLDGEQWLSMGLKGMLMAAHQDKYLPSCLFIFVHSGGREQRWQEQAGDFPFADFLADELLVEALEGTAQKLGEQEVVVVGQSLGGLSALLAVLKRPDVFTAACAQSASLWQEIAFSQLEDASQGQAFSPRHRLFLEVGEQEWVLLPAHERFVTRARELGVVVDYQTYNGGHDYACWRGSLIPALRRLLHEGLK
ncbi:enterochelin esterase domain-containing protein [Rothia sp. P4278]|uniref:enterochelin esterase domain-containing protein n=1 Tax=Rothia sp. P4278 TaxID=3402658 RepID=UPI003ADDA1FE